MNEFELIRRYFERPARRALAGVGDDCAVVRPSQPGLELAITTDMLVEGRHFASGADPRSLGHKSLAVNLSDLAAMGATPRYVLLALGIPAADPAWVAAFAEGFFALAEQFDAELIGGDTVRAASCTICITAIGEVPAGQAMYRGSALAGDDIWVSGELGGAALGLLHPDAPGAAERLHRPQPRVRLGERLRGLAHAAIDVSDGLGADLGHILERSKVAGEVRYDRIPRVAALSAFDETLRRRCTLAGGDDYELLFTAPSANAPEIEAVAAALALRLTRIGSIRAGAPQLQVLDDAGQPISLAAGFDHFAAERG